VAHPQAFPKSLRLRKRAEFLRVQERGAKVGVGPLLALAVVNQTATTRIGLTVSSKVGGAVERVRIRRRLREVFRKERQKLPKGLDVVLIARTAARSAEYEALAKAFDEIAVKLRGLFP
jgi:ribonuclease P protein component